MRKAVSHTITAACLAITAASLGFATSRLVFVRSFSLPPPPPLRGPATDPGRPALPPPEKWTNVFAPAQGMEIPSRLRPASPGQAQAPATAYLLLGTISSDSRAARRAILWAEGFKHPRLAREHEEIEPGLRVERIERDRIVLLRGGTRETLDLLPVGSRSRAAAAPGAPVPAPAAASTGASPSPETGPPLRVSRIAENVYSLDEGSVAQLAGNINQFMTQVRVIPYFEGNRSAGYRIASVRPGSAFEQLGFRGGDVIQRVNDVELSSPEKLYTIFQNLRDEKRVDVNILRQGQKSTIRYEIR